jgi:crotonobetainyl-CoA:carnitine CoA-transferase CaiB-like acyl-CoA transferase
MGAPPRQPGADTDAVLADFGFLEAEISRLRQAGVVGAPGP